MSHILFRIATDSNAAKELLEQLEESEAREKEEFFDEEEADSENTDFESYTSVTAFDEIVINRLDNLLAVNILSACFLFLLFYLTVKRR